MSIELSKKELESIKYFLAVLEGRDPEAQQMLNNFMKFDSIIERTSLPTKRDVHFIAYTDYCGNAYFPNIKNNPFSNLVESVSRASMARGGLKSNQVVDIVRNNPSLSELIQAQTIQQGQQQKGLFDRLLGRGTPTE